MTKRHLLYILALCGVIVASIWLRERHQVARAVDAHATTKEPSCVVGAPLAASPTAKATPAEPAEDSSSEVVHDTEREEDPENDWPNRHLSADDMRGLEVALAEAERASIASLQDAVILAAQAHDGRDLHYRAWLLAWVLARQPAGLEAVQTRLLETAGQSDLSRQLLLAVGMVGTQDSIRSLLRWLDDHALASYAESILDALHQAPSSRLDVLAHRYSLYLKGSGTWPADLLDQTIRSDRNVLVATLNRATDDPRIEVRRKAAGLVFSVDGPGRSPVDEDIRAAIRLVSLRMIRHEEDRESVLTALTYVSGTPDVEIEAALLDRLRGPATDHQLRVRCASVLARYAASYEDATRVLEWARTEKDPGVRSGFLSGLQFVGRSSNARSMLSQQIESMAAADPDENVRITALSCIGRLLPESEDNLAWALRDTSSRVRSLAETLQKKAESRR